MPNKPELNLIAERFREASSFWSESFDYNRTLIRDHRMEWAFKKDSETNETAWQWRSKAFVPFSNEKLSTIFPHVMKGMMGREDFFSITPKRPHLDMMQAQKTEQLLKYQLDARNFIYRLIPTIFQMVALGYGIVRTRWRYIEKLQHYRRTASRYGFTETQDEDGEWRPVEKYDGPDFDPVPFFRFYPDPDTPPMDIQQANYIIEEIIQPMWQFEADAEYFGYKNVDEVKKVFEGEQGVRSRNDQRSATLTGSQGTLVRLLWHHDHDVSQLIAAPEGSEGENAQLVHEVDPQKAFPHGEYPYVMFCCDPAIDEGSDSTGDDPGDDHYKPGSVFPLGLLHTLHGLQKGVNTSFNQRFDSILMAMNPPLIINGKALKDIGDLEFGWRPAQILEADTAFGGDITKAIFQVPLQIMSGMDWAHQWNSMFELGERVSAANDIIAGRTSAQNKTATGIVQVTENASERFRSKVFIAIESGLKPLLNQYVHLNAEFMTPDTELYITGQPNSLYIGNPSEDVLRECSIRIRPAAFYNRQLQAEIIVKLIPLLMQHPQINVTAVFREMLKKLEDVFDDVDAILPDEAQPMTAQMIMQQQALLQAAVKQLSSTYGGKTPNSAPGTEGVPGIPGGFGPPQSDAQGEVGRIASLFG